MASWSGEVCKSGDWTCAASGMKPLTPALTRNDIYWILGKTIHIDTDLHIYQISYKKKAWSNSLMSEFFFFFRVQMMHRLPPSSRTGHSSRPTKLFVTVTFSSNNALLQSNKFSHLKKKKAYCKFTNFRCVKMGPVWIRHSSHDFGWQSSHSVDLAGWQAKMASIEIWIPWRNAHKSHFGGERLRSVRCSLNFGVGGCCRDRSMCFRVQVSF